MPKLPTIETQRLRLRPLVLTDADAFRRMTDAPGTAEAVHFLNSPFTREDAESLLMGAGDGKGGSPSVLFWTKRAGKGGIQTPQSFSSPLLSIIVPLFSTF
jgi:hypothetical protein